MAYMNPAPDKKPAVAISQGAVIPLSLALSTAGLKSDQKLADIITPAAKPRSSRELWASAFLYIKTAAAPMAVKSHVTVVAARAYRILLK